MWSPHLARQRLHGDWGLLFSGSMNTLIRDVCFHRGSKGLVVRRTRKKTHRDDPIPGCSNPRFPSSTLLPFFFEGSLIKTE